jgi:inorganic triphosphatase YgiF
VGNITELEENEIKLVAVEVTQAKLLASLRGKKNDEQDTILQTIKAVLHLAEFDISPEKVEMIVDEYFDTQDSVLFRTHTSLRVRRSGGQAEVTVKKPKEQEQGLFSRTELSQTISEEQYTQFVKDNFYQIIKSTLPDLIGKPFSKILRIDNERRSFILRRGSEQYELSLDLITFTNPKTKKRSDTLSEIEIEALNKAAKQKLGSIKRHLVEIIKTFGFSHESKYERGIKCFGLDRPQSRNWFSDRISNFNTSAGREWIAITIAIISLIATIVIGLMTRK